MHHFREMLRIRKSSPLFRLRTAEDVTERVKFLNTGRDQVPGLMVMEILDDVDGLAPIDPVNRRVVVLVNARKETVEFDAEVLKGVPLELHPVQTVSHDELVKQTAYDFERARFSVPGRTTAVFVERD